MDKMDKLSTQTVQKRSARRPGVAASEDASLGRGDWIKAAIVLLSENSVDALRVDELAKRLGVTKGSFYWHFPTREHLLRAVLETWRVRMTDGIQAYITDHAKTPAARLSHLLRVAITPRPDVPGGPLELSLRDWARRDPAVSAVIETVDTERVAYLKRLYIEAGLGNDEAQDNALAHLALTVGMRMVLFDAKSKSLEQRYRIGEAFLVPKTTTQEPD